MCVCVDHRTARSRAGRRRTGSETPGRRALLSWPPAGFSRAAKLFESAAIPVSPRFANCKFQISKSSFFLAILTLIVKSEAERDRESADTEHHQSLTAARGVEETKSLSSEAEDGANGARSALLCEGCVRAVGGRRQVPDQKGPLEVETRERRSLHLPGSSLI